jgi:hypothetical protein
LRRISGAQPTATPPNSSLHRTRTGVLLHSGGYTFRVARSKPLSAKRWVRKMKVRIFAVVLLALVASPEARACSPIIYIPHVVRPEEQRTDRRRPRRPAAALTTIRRAEPEVTFNGDLMTVNTCGGTAYAIVHIVSKDLDETTPSTELGFTWELVGGRHVPKGLSIQPPVEQLPISDLMVLWAEPDGSSDVDFQIVVRAVDRAGNKSKPSRVIRVQHGGT